MLISSRPPTSSLPNAGVEEQDEIRGPFPNRYRRDGGGGGVFEATLAICSCLGKLQMKPSVRRNKRPTEERCTVALWG